MTWMKIEDSLPEDPQSIEIGEDACWLFVCAIAYCSRNLTDGKLPKNVVPRLTSKRNVAALTKKLLAIGWLREEGGEYVVVNYLKYQRSKAEVVQDREYARRRTALNANPELSKAIKTRDHNRCRYCGVPVNWRDRRGPTGGTYDHIVPITAGGQETMENIVVACRRCNSAKGARPLAESGLSLRPVPAGNLQETYPGSSRAPSPESESEGESESEVGDVKKSQNRGDLTPDVVAARLNLACKNHNTEEAWDVVNKLSTHVDLALIDECVGYAMKLDMNHQPTSPRYFLTAVADWADKRGVAIPELKL